MFIHFSIIFQECLKPLEVLGLVDAGHFDTAYAVVLLLVNCSMQILFSGHQMIS